METVLHNDTICAPATGRGGAISIIRLSGSISLKVAGALFRASSGKALEDAAGYSLHYGTFGPADGEALDEVMVASYRAPHSYTGEDMVEIFCHASPYIVERILSLLIEGGARMAQPGEFTRRAFIAGKMDMAQAEAVADVISASTEASLRVARNQLKGGYSKELKALRGEMLSLSVLLELELDFSEEEVEFADRTRLITLTTEALGKVRALESSFRVGNAIKNGVPVAIVGAPNCGKSTLLNALTGENRAIVSDIAGTTRDTVEGTMTIDGVQYRFIDTAGIRDTADDIERQGVERSLEAAGKADVVIWVRTEGDCGCADGLSDDGLSATLRGCLTNNQALIEVTNKVDVSPALPGTLGISALRGTGLDELRSRISATQRGRLEAEGTIVTNLRHFEALKAAGESLESLIEGLESGRPTDLLAEDLREAISSLGSIWGEGGITAPETLQAIFGRFCIGK